MAVVAKHAFPRHGTARARKRLRYKAKWWLNMRAAEQMTPLRLAARDAGGEIRAWLASIAGLSTRK